MNSNILNETIEAIKSQGLNIEPLALALKISIPQVYYRIRELKKMGKLNDEGKIVSSISSPSTHSPSVIPPVLPVQPSFNPSESLNMDDFIPAVDHAYIIREAIDLEIEKQLQRRNSIALVGEAGTGKTKSAEQFAARSRLPFLRISCDESSNLKEYIGRREIINFNTVFQSGLLSTFFKIPSVILFDEFNALPSAKLFFFHELLDFRKFFLKEKKQGEVITLHENCKIFLACNPPSAKYSGTSKINVALGERPVVLYATQFRPEEIKSVFDTGNDKLTADLMKYYSESLALIKRENLRMNFSLRAVKRIVIALKEGDNTKQALAVNFYNSAYLTASEKEVKIFEDLAKVIFGIIE